MRIGLVGFGKTGKAVANVFLHELDFELCWVLRRSRSLDTRSLTEFLGEKPGYESVIHSIDAIGAKELLDLSPVDVIVDFSSPEGMDYYYTEAEARGITVITAVSHYPAERIQQLNILARRTKVFYSPNITLGVNFLLIAARVLKQIAPNIDMVVLEEHFKAKEGVSGTAQVIAGALGIETEEIKSIRAGGIIGKHEIICGFPYQTVRLVHDSITREAFGNGAAFVARNLVNKAPGFYTFEDLLAPYFLQGFSMATYK